MNSACNGLLNVCAMDVAIRAIPSIDFEGAFLLNTGNYILLNTDFKVLKN